MADDIIVHTDPDLAVFVATDDLAIFVESDLKVSQSQKDDLRVFSDAGLPGQRGPMGPSPSVSKYLEDVSLLDDGVLTIDCALGSTAYAMLTDNVTDIVFLNAPPDGWTQRIELVVRQDANGAWTIFPDAWPTGTKGPNGQAPVVSSAPFSEDRLLLDLTDTELSVTLVGRGYAPFA